jgi:flagella basal body P-ring formation protein FlgA
MKCSRPLLRPRNSFARIRAGVAFILAGIVLASAPAEAAVRSRTVIVEGERITLGDLSPTVPRELLALDVGPAPAPGKSSIVSRAAVQEALRRAGADPALAAAMPVRSQIERAGLQLSRDALAVAVREAASAELPVGVAIDTVLGLSNVLLPKGEHRVDVSLGKLRRSTVATVDIIAGGRRWARQQATLQLSGTARTPVLRSDLPKGTTVKAEHVELENVAIDDVPEGAMMRAEDLVGQRLRSRTNAKNPVRKAAVEAPPVIARGDVVNLVARGHGIKISRQAVAQQDGAIGQTIRVKASGGDEVLLGKIESETLVVVGLGSGAR